MPNNIFQGTYNDRWFSIRWWHACMKHDMQSVLMVWGSVFIGWFAWPCGRSHEISIWHVRATYAYVSMHAKKPLPNSPPGLQSEPWISLSAKLWIQIQKTIAAPKRQNHNTILLVKRRRFKFSLIEPFFTRWSEYRQINIYAVLQGANLSVFFNEVRFTLF